jgi:hypothetical protein
MPNIACQLISSKYTNTILKKIVNVYQIQFLDFKAPGFGDYIRGCFCMMQLINTLNAYCGTNVTFEMDLRNHPMSKYIEVQPFDSTIPYSKLGNFHIDSLKVPQNEDSNLFQHILRQTTEYMNKLKMDTFYCFCCKYEVYNEILEKDKEHIRSFLKPNAIMQSLIQSTLGSFGLKSKGYSVLHIRWRDEESFPPRKPSEVQFNKVTSLINANLDATKQYILISNHNAIKEYYRPVPIKNEHLPATVEAPDFNIQRSKSLAMPNLHVQIGEICHVGQDLNQTDIQVRDTMLDFFLLANAESILGLSPYEHGTGFSQECGKLYNVPHRLLSYK